MIIDWLKENKIEKDHEEAVDNATKRFLNQRNSIREIFDKKGYKEIKRWLSSERDNAMKVVMASGKNKIEERARYNAADRLLTFLENLENAK
jgi:hypothetical protein